MPEPAGRGGDLAERARSAVSAWADARDDVPVTHDGDRWTVTLAGERKRSLAVVLSVGDHTLTAQAHLMRAPDDDAAAVHALLLRRNLRSYTLRFAIDRDGDVLLVAVLPLHAVTTDELDRTLGQFLAVADATFDEALRAGFPGYIAREQAWRAAAGMPPNPIAPPE